MAETTREQTRIFTETILSVLQGRPGETRNDTQPEQSSPQSSLDEDDLEPLPNGIEAILYREQNEEQRERLRLLQERADLQRTLAEAAARERPASPPS